jgi:aminopeptidase
MDYGKWAGRWTLSVCEWSGPTRCTSWPRTDLRFSIKGLPAIKCAGEMNIPDGEVYTAPVRTSVNGTVSYNAPSPHDGFTYENVRLTFRDGKIIDAAANDTERVNKVFVTRRGRALRGRIRAGREPLHHLPDEGHPV